MRSFFDDELVVNRRCSKLGCALYFSCGLIGGLIPSIFKKKKKQYKTKQKTTTLWDSFGTALK